MKGLKEIKDNVALNHGFDSWDDLVYKNTTIQPFFVDEVAKQVVDQTLEGVAENVTILKVDEEGRGDNRKSFVIGGDVYVIDKDSILDLNNDPQP